MSDIKVLRTPPSPAVEIPASARITGATVVTLQAFDAAFRLGSFKAAAQALRLTESAISHRVRKLERLLGERLFDRLHRRVAPTPAGEELAALTGRAFRELARACEPRGGGSRRSVLRLSVFPLFASAWLTPRLADFISANPGVELSINATTQLVDLGSGAVDAVIRSGSGDWPGLTAVPLMQLQTIPLVSQKLVEDLPDIEAEALLRLPIIQMSDFPQAWSVWAAAQGIPFTKPAATVWVEGFEAAMLAAEQGAGVALGLWPLCRPSIAAGHVVEPPGMRIDAARCWLAFRSDDLDHPSLKVFRAWLEAECGRSLAGA